MFNNEDKKRAANLFVACQALAQSGDSNMKVKQEELTFHKVYELKRHPAASVILEYDSKLIALSHKEHRDRSMKKPFRR